MPGAAGYQLSNPSILDLTALLASLSLFSAAKMTAIRTKSVLLTGYLDHLLKTQFEVYDPKPFVLITPLDPAARGAQLSLLFKGNLMLPVFYTLLGQGIVVDERKPDVIRVAPVPLYNTFEEVWEFVQALRSAIDLAIQGGQSMNPVEAGEGMNP
jgi:kynureninase